MLGSALRSLGNRRSLTSMPPISGTIISYNEEQHIEACVASLRRVCAEVVVVDSHSTDRTVELATAAGARVISEAYAGQGPQRNRTEQLAAHDWILALDADERLDDEMCASIAGLRLEDPAIGYAFNRKSFVGGRWFRGPGFYPDFVTRLYNRTRAAYEPRPGHAGVRAPRMKRVPGHILHYTYNDLSDWIAKINWLTSRDARGLFNAGRPPSTVRPVASALASGFRQLVLRGGFLRGADGWTSAVTTMFYSHMKYLKLNELHTQAGRNDAAGNDERHSSLSVGDLRDSAKR